MKDQQHRLYTFLAPAIHYLPGDVIAHPRITSRAQAQAQGASFLLANAAKLAVLYLKSELYPYPAFLYLSEREY